MAWLTSNADLRIALSDGPADKLMFNKQVFGTQNGVNTMFKTFEFRRVTDFSASGNDATLGMYINSILVAASGIVADDPTVGVVKLLTPPANTDQVTAAYYIQWFTDAELSEFLIQSCNWIGVSQDPSLMDPGLIPSALQYSCYQAYKKLSLRYAMNAGETFRLEDSADPKKMSVVAAYQAAASAALKDATTLRNDFYTRKGMAKAPNFISIAGSVTDVTPRR
jgi:hypothetical protein